MTQEEKQLLLKDLCARIPYSIKFKFNNVYTAKGVDIRVTDDGRWDFFVTAYGIKPIEIEYIKPYLRPMSSMTEEEEKEFLSLESGLGYDTKNKNTIYLTNKIDWLNTHHFDYRGLIPMGLALESSEDMYKL